MQVTADPIVSVESMSYLETDWLIANAVRAGATYLRTDRQDIQRDGVVNGWHEGSTPCILRQLASDLRI